MTEVRAFRRNAVGTESQPADKRRIGQPAGANSTVGAVQRRTAHADQNTAAPEIISMPDGFSNVAANCDGPNMVYVIFHIDSAYGS